MRVFDRVSTGEYTALCAGDFTWPERPFSERQPLCIKCSLKKSCEKEDDAPYYGAKDNKVIKPAPAPKAKRSKTVKSYAELVDDIRSYLDNGMPPKDIAAQMGTNCSALSRKLYRKGEIELGRAFGKANLEGNSKK